MVVHTLNSSTQESEATGSRVPDQPGLHSEFQSSLNCIVRLYLKKPETGGSHIQGQPGLHKETLSKNQKLWS
jgi:hypothetical protein